MDITPMKPETMNNLIFIDTEFADVEANEWVSIGLAPFDADRASFYVERKVLPVATEFVREVVYPLLQRDQSAMPDAMASDAVRRYLNGFPQPVAIAYDHDVDWRVLLCVINHHQARELMPDLEAVDMSKLGDAYWIALDKVWEQDAERRKRRHHALVDATVQREAYISALATIRGQLLEPKKPGALQKEHAMTMPDSASDSIRTLIPSVTDG